MNACISHLNRNLKRSKVAQWFIILLMLTFAVLFLEGGCGSSGGDDGDNTKLEDGDGSSGGDDSDNIKQGFLFDSPIEGVKYNSTGTSGKTDVNGAFEYKPNSRVTFRIGNQVLGTVKGQKLVTPFDLAKSQIEQMNATGLALSTSNTSDQNEDIENCAVTMAQVLQNLDKDQNPNNGIEITDNTHRATVDITEKNNLFVNSKLDTESKEQIKSIVSKAQNKAKETVQIMSRASAKQALSNAQYLQYLENNNEDIYEFLKNGEYFKDMKDRRLNDPGERELKDEAFNDLKSSAKKRVELATFMFITQQQLQAVVNTKKKHTEIKVQQTQATNNMTEAVQNTVNLVGLASLGKNPKDMKQFKNYFESSMSGVQSIIKLAGSDQNAEASQLIAQKIVDSFIQISSKIADDLAGKATFSVMDTINLAFDGFEVGLKLDQISRIAQSVQELNGARKGLQFAQKWFWLGQDLERVQKYINNITDYEFTMFPDTSHKPYPNKHKNKRRALLDEISAHIDNVVRHNTSDENLITLTEPHIIDYSKWSNNKLRRIYALLAFAQATLSEAKAQPALAIDQFKRGIEQSRRLAKELIGSELPNGYAYFDSNFSNGEHFVDSVELLNKDTATGKCRIGITIQGLEKVNSYNKLAISWGNGETSLIADYNNHSKATYDAEKDILKVKHQYRSPGKYTVIINNFGHTVDTTINLTDLKDAFPNLDEFTLDMDGDGLPDQWEEKHFGGLGYDGEDDPDFDGLTNIVEFYGEDLVDYNASLNDITLSNPLVADVNTYYKDADGDGYGVASQSLTSAVKPTGYVLKKGDCNDSNYHAYPGAEEERDLIDNDCDGSVDEGWITVLNLPYTEKFEEDITFVKYSSSNGSHSILERDSDAGNYFVKIKTDTDPNWWEGALTPKFGPINPNESFQVEFDFNPVEYGFGLYPSVRGVLVLGDNPKKDWDSVWNFDNHDSAKLPQKLRFSYRTSDSRSESFVKDTPKYDAWYHVKIIHNAEKDSGSLMVTDANGNYVFKKKDFSWQLSQAFDHLWIGDMQGGQDWGGDDASIRVDNINVTIK